MRKLYFTTGSPFARAVRIVLQERGLEFERDETFTTPSAEERAKVSPTLQVPILVDGSKKLWDPNVILEYLMLRYAAVEPPHGHRPFARDYIRLQHVWDDKLTYATLQTFGVSTATISQLQWSGVTHEDNAHASRCAARNQHLLDWFESQLVSEEDGFVPDVVSVQDVLLVAGVSSSSVDRFGSRGMLLIGRRSQHWSIAFRSGRRFNRSRPCGGSRA